jgi:integrase
MSREIPILTTPPVTRKLSGVESVNPKQQEAESMKAKLTERTIRGLAPTGAPCDILHERTPAAGLRLTALGAKIWIYLYRSPVVRDARGQPKLRRAYLGYHPSGRRPDRQPGGRFLAPLTLEEFERAYDAFRGDLARGIDPQEVVAVRPEAAQWIAPDSVPEIVRPLLPEGYREGTFAALLVDYFRHRAPLHLTTRTALNYKQAARSFLPAFGHRPPAEISDRDIRSLLTTVEKRAPQVVRDVKKALSVLFEYGRSHWHLAANPARGVPVTVKKGKRDRWLTDAELTTALAAIDALSDRKAADVYTLILHSMCRPGEAAFAEAEDILSSNGEPVWRFRGKNGKELLVPLVGPIGEVLNRRCLQVGGKGALFWQRDKCHSYPAPLKAANAEFRRLTGLDNIRPHDLRRTGRTHIPALGVAECVAEALLNHAKGEIEGTYNLYDYWAERKEALRRWHEKLARLAPCVSGNERS